jgi:hypothetical protein
MRKQWVVLALVALVAGLVGTVAPAMASGLSSHAVRKIAAKVAGKQITKEAPSLSVAHATTADQATLLDGQTAASLQTPVYGYVLPQTGYAVTKTYHFPGLPAGTYLVAYDVASELSAVPPDPVQCYFSETGVTHHFAFEFASSNGGIASCSGTAPVEVGSGSNPTLVVFSDGTTNRIYANFTSTVTFTRVNALSVVSAS